MKHLIGALAIMAVLTTVALYCRPILPVDETRYVSVAWEAYHHGDWLVSHKNGELYAHKPPLLFWLINMIWSLTGVSNWGARIVGPLAGMACLPVVYWLARQLWPDDRRTAQFTPLILASMAPWMLFAPLTMFDTLLTLSTLIAVCGIVRAAQGFAGWGWALAGVGMGMGILTKGPVIFVQVLPLALMVFWWAGARWSVTQKDSTDNNCSGKQSNTLSPMVSQLSLKFWYGGLCASIALAGAIGLSWAIPSAISGGPAYANELLLGQTTGRVVQSFSHRHHLLWYLPLLPLCTLPWITFGSVWRGWRMIPDDSGYRLLISWTVGSLLILSLISGKQVHYLMPLFPAIAMLLARSIASANLKVRQYDLAVVAWGTVFLGVLPLLFNRLELAKELGLAGIVPEIYVPMMMAVGVMVWLWATKTTDIAVPRLAGLSAATICLFVIAGATNFWQGFSVDQLAGYVGKSERPVLWYGEYHAQLNFAGRLDHIDVANSEQEMQQWLSQHPEGLVLLRLTGSGADWDSLMAGAEQQTDSQLTADKSQQLCRLIASRPEFSRQSQSPTPISLFWIRHGLKKKPYVVISHLPSAEPLAVAQFANRQTELR